MTDGTPIRRRRAAKYVRGGFRVCYLCGYNTPDEIHHTSYFPEEAVAVCEGCHSYIHSSADTGLEPDEKRPNGYETTRRRQEKEEVDYSRAWQARVKQRLYLNHLSASGTGWSGELPHPETEAGDHL